MMRTFFVVAALTTSVCGPCLAAAPAATPVPGGANQARAVEGSLQSTLFNGEVRVRKMSLGTPDGSPDESGFVDAGNMHWIVFRAVMSNGTKRVLDLPQYSASIADADGVTIAAQPDKVRPLGTVLNVPPGGAWKERVFFEVPKDFTPAKIVLIPAPVASERRYGGFRIAVAAQTGS